MVNKNGCPGPMHRPFPLDMFKSLVMMTSLQNACCSFGCSKPPDVDGIKIFDKDDQVAKH